MVVPAVMMVTMMMRVAKMKVVMGEGWRLVHGDDRVGGSNGCLRGNGSERHDQSDNRRDQYVEGEVFHGDVAFWAVARGI